VAKASHYTLKERDKPERGQGCNIYFRHLPQSWLWWHCGGPSECRIIFRGLYSLLFTHLTH